MTSPLMLGLTLALGLVILVVAGDLLVRGASALARRAGVSQLIVGLTIVALGTSAPETFVSVQAALGDEPGLALGNIVGSNIANVFLVLGLPALIIPMAASKWGTRRNAFTGLGATIALLLIAFCWSPLGFAQGGALLAALAGYLGIQYWRAQRRDWLDPEIAEIRDVDLLRPHKPRVFTAYIVAGLIGLPLGAALIVRAGVGLAEAFSVPKEFIGLTAVAVGTSLPELSASFVAALRRNTEVAIGNVLGSNIFNILGVGGATAIAAGVSAEGGAAMPASFLTYDLWAMLAAQIALVLVTLGQRGVPRLLGVVFVLLYAAYLTGLAHVEDIIRIEALARLGL